MIVDKTGTLTEGRPAFDKVVAVDGVADAGVLRLAASLDQGSEHPLAAAIVTAARQQGVQLAKVDEFESSSGVGVRGVVEGRRLALGNIVLMRQEGVDVSALAQAAEAERERGASVMYLAGDGRLLGLIAVSDPIKASTPDAVASLHAAGIRVVMATGDGLTTARSVAHRLHIDEVHGEVKPADKLALVEKLQKEGCVVGMAGDGINDAPALAKADVGVAARRSPSSKAIWAASRARAPSPSPPSGTCVRILRSRFCTTRSAYRLQQACYIRLQAGCCRP
jgi:Cu+-exporting ATPase